MQIIQLYLFKMFLSQLTRKKNESILDMPSGPFSLSGRNPANCFTCSVFQFEPQLPNVKRQHRVTPFSPLDK